MSCRSMVPPSVILRRLQQSPRTPLNPLQNRVIPGNRLQDRGDILYFDRPPIAHHLVQDLQFRIQAETPMLILTLQLAAFVKSCGHGFKLVCKLINLGELAPVVGATAFALRGPRTANVLVPWKAIFFAPSSQAIANSLLLRAVANMASRSAFEMWMGRSWASAGILSPSVGGGPPLSERKCPLPSSPTVRTYFGGCNFGFS